MASSYANIVVASPQVKLGVDLGTAETGQGELVTSGSGTIPVSVWRFKVEQSQRVPSFFFANRLGHLLGTGMIG